MTTGFSFDPAKHVYKLDGKRMTGVTTILGVINKPALVGWAANMAVDYIKENCEYIGNTFEDRDGDYYLVSPTELQEARKAHTRKKDARAVEGSDVHAEIETYIKACIEEDGHAVTLLDHEMAQPADSFARFVRWAVDNKVQFLESEKVMYHPEWFVGGTADFVCLIDGKKYVGDIKTQKKIWDRVPFFQMAAYRGMLEQMGETDFHGSLIVHLPMEGELETHYSFDYESDLDGFLSALKLYRLLNNY